MATSRKERLCDPRERDGDSKGKAWPSQGKKKKKKEGLGNPGEKGWYGNPRGKGYVNLRGKSLG